MFFIFRSIHTTSKLKNKIITIHKQSIEPKSINIFKPNIFNTIYITLPFGVSRNKLPTAILNDILSNYFPKLK